jgi:hypothetical protein
MAIIGEEVHPALINIKLKTKSIFSVTNFAVFDVYKILKTSIKQSYIKPRNQKWRALVKKRTLHCPKTNFL